MKLDPERVLLKFHLIFFLQKFFLMMNSFESETYFAALNCHQPVQDGSDQQFQAIVHSPLSSAELVTTNNDGRFQTEESGQYREPDFKRAITLVLMAEGLFGDNMTKLGHFSDRRLLAVFRRKVSRVSPYILENEQ